MQLLLTYEIRELSFIQVQSIHLGCICIVHAQTDLKFKLKLIHKELYPSNNWTIKYINYVLIYVLEYEYTNASSSKCWKDIILSELIFIGISSQYEQEQHYIINLL